VNNGRNLTHILISTQSLGKQANRKGTMAGDASSGSMKEVGYQKVVNAGIATRTGTKKQKIIPQFNVPPQKLQRNTCHRVPPLPPFKAILLPLVEQVRFG